MFIVLHHVDHTQRAESRERGPETEVGPERFRLGLGLKGCLKSGDEDQRGENNLFK